MKKQNLLTFAGFFGMTAVILGAFGAHALKVVLSEAQLLTFETGTKYHFYHALALLALAFWQKETPQKLLTFAANCFIIGIFLFSGSIYLLACRDILGIQNWSFLGPITPIGGTFFIIGWGFVFAQGLKKD